MRRRILLPAIVGLTVGLLVPAAGASAMPAGPAGSSTSAGPAGAVWPTNFHAWTDAADFARGDGNGVIPVGVGDGAVRLAPNAEQGSWTSPWYETPKTTMADLADLADLADMADMADMVAFTQAVPSWQADTPGGSWIEVELQVRTADATSSWYRMASWAFESTAIERRTHAGQSDGVGSIYTDEFVAADGVRATGFRMRAVLHGADGDRPTIRQLGSSTSRPGEMPGTSEPIRNDAVELDVPAYSQMIHRGEYPEFGGGGQVWCSPTSTAMVLSYYGTGPTKADIESLPPDPVFDQNGRVDGEVPYAALHTWDYTYDGAGNWAFNVAYASAYGVDATVRRQSSLRDVERLVRDGVPVVITTQWDNTDDEPRNDLDGAAIPSSDGHLMVVVGFTESGDVIANDPAAASNAEVRRVYARDQFEYNWRDSAEGLTYVIRDGSGPERGRGAGGGRH